MVKYLITLIFYLYLMTITPMIISLYVYMNTTFKMLKQLLRFSEIVQILIIIVNPINLIK